MANFQGNLPEYAFGSRTLRFEVPNIRGTDVKVFQRIYDTMLELMNPPLGPMGSRILIDGIFGPETHQAVLNVQSYFGIGQDGIIGPQTYNVLGQDTKAYGGPAFGSRPLGLGDQGGDVTVLQNRLNCLWYAEKLSAPADGLFGNHTQQGVLAFQGDNLTYRHWTLPFDGTVDASTFNILWISAFTGGRNLLEGRNGFDTAGLQVILKNLAFYRGRIDGYYGQKTQDAVKSFQKVAGITVDGIAGPQTFHALGITNRVFWYSSDERPRSLISTLNTIVEISSTIDPINHDNNPYAITIAPYTFDDTNTVLKHGDLVVSNINNASGVMGLGTTIERIVNGQPQRFFGEAKSPIAVAISNLGPPWIADYGLNPNGSDGVVQVITPNGTLFSGGNIRRPLFAGPWGMQFNFGEFYGLAPAFFSTNVLTGTIDRMTHFHPSNFNGDTVVRQIGSGFAHVGTTISTVFGPQGLVWLPMGDVLYVANGADSRISALSPATTTSSDLNNGLTVYHGAPLNKPAGLALNPENGHLVAVNQGNNEAIELNPRTGRVMSRKTLDPTPVNPVTGQGSALFGIAIAVDDSGDLLVYYTDDNTNTLNLLKR
ncbi:peptidoglycan-binding protein [Sulfobacillus thermosulfidooxidans]|uniref:peptidoglycan-binding protein n=1 Tax=Sulfobacillus thermosulfidooxidans TaxID=28034 RepID=UPI0006B415B2|nr:peptidoglycan-binding protein [Sulfobacillus thermosulfidooxidans]